ncbi:MAG: 4'-phosphopantetheinyl transferase superfamily protein [Deltaproteobacteria bacterium]|nr:4'-phosphopantetheinyl transferase superfamily protein [Deltaproteobacteria bacterium]
MSIDLWQVRLWADPAALQHLQTILDPQERARTERFVFPWLGVRYTVAHAALRVIVAHALGRHPASLQWERGRHGKPALPGAPVSFNLSHCDDWGLIAVTDGEPVGVDLEAIAPVRVTPEMVRSVTSPTEQLAIEAMSPHARALAFYRLWVRKEAVIKALGTGLSRSLHTIDVPLGAEPHVDGIELRPPPDTLTRWRVWDVPAPTGHFAAVVVGQITRGPVAPPRPVRTVSVDDLRHAIARYGPAYPG